MYKAFVLFVVLGKLYTELEKSTRNFITYTEKSISKRQPSSSVINHLHACINKFIHLAAIIIMNKLLFNWRAGDR